MLHVGALDVVGVLTAVAGPKARVPRLQGCVALDGACKRSPCDAELPSPAPLLFLQLDAAVEAHSVALDQASCCFHVAGHLIPRRTSCAPAVHLPLAVLCPLHPALHSLPGSVFTTLQAAEAAAACEALQAAACLHTRLQAAQAEARRMFVVLAEMRGTVKAPEWFADFWLPCLSARWRLHCAPVDFPASSTHMLLQLAGAQAMNQELAKVKVIHTSQVGWQAVRVLGAGPLPCLC